jgi:hypothetical protein
MTEYKIERFDSILNGEIGNIALPVIYIKTDQEFLEFAKKNNYIIGCKIKNSGTIYEGKLLTGILNNNVLNRPNFFKQTGLSVITLLVKWNGYPEYGTSPTITFFELNEDINTQTNTQTNIQTNTQTITQTNTQTNNISHNLKEKNNSNYINILKITSLTILFLLFLLIAYKNDL